MGRSKNWEEEKLGGKVFPLGQKLGGKVFFGAKTWRQKLKGIFPAGQKLGGKVFFGAKTGRQGLFLRKFREATSLVLCTGPGRFGRLVRLDRLVRLEIFG